MLQGSVGNKIDIIVFFWDEGVVNISKTLQMLTISGFPAWENNEQEENKNVPGLLLPKD